jgi:hypothetical protein
MVSVQTVRADDTTVIPQTVTGEILGAYRALNTIVIEERITGESVTIVGFPFNNLEAQLGEGTTIDEGNCVTIDYSEKELCSGDVVNKWDSLTEYCEMCPVDLKRLAPLSCNDVVDLSLTREPRQNRPNP